MSERLKHLTKIALGYLADAKWPPANLVEQIGAEAVRVGQKPPIEYELIISPEYASEGIRYLFKMEPDTRAVITYHVQDPFGGHDGNFEGIKDRLKRPLNTAPGLIPAERYPPGKHIACAIQAWIEYLNVPAPAEPAAPPGGNGEKLHRRFRALLAVYVGRKITNEAFQQIFSILDSGKPFRDKLREIDRTLPIPLDASSRTIADLLECSHTTIENSPWWEKNRSGRREEESAEREERIRQRGNQWE